MKWNWDALWPNFNSCLLAPSLLPFLPAIFCIPNHSHSHSHEQNQDCLCMYWLDILWCHLVSGSGFISISRFLENLCCLWSTSKYHWLFPFIPALFHISNHSQSKIKTVSALIENCLMSHRRLNLSTFHGFLRICIAWSSNHNVISHNNLLYSQSLPSSLPRVITPKAKSRLSLLWLKIVWWVTVVWIYQHFTVSWESVLLWV